MLNRSYRLRPEVIRDLLDKHHLNHRGFADELQISRSYWSQLLNRGRPLTPRLRRALLTHPLIQESGLLEQEIWTIDAGEE